MTWRGEVDRLAIYLYRNFPEDMRKGDTPIDTALRLLERLKKKEVKDV